MKRPYIDNESESVTFFIGTEVEHTPAHGLKTLFVVGVHKFEDIKKILDDPLISAGGPIQHIYFGANMSFPKLEINDYHNWSLWEIMIEHCLNQGYLCTLDIPVDCVEGLLESNLCEHHQFIPMISVKLPYVQQLGYNATIKLDDKDFAATNPGVWCHSLHSLMKRDMVFTDWSKYTKDQIVSTTSQIK